jgi:hypothetical protein
MEKIRWTDHVKSGEILHRVKGERNILHSIHRRKGNWIDHILHRNCLVKYDIEGENEGWK